MWLLASKVIGLIVFVKLGIGFDSINEDDEEEDDIDDKDDDF